MWWRAHHDFVGHQYSPFPKYWKTPFLSNTAIWPVGAVTSWPPGPGGLPEPYAPYCLSRARSPIDPTERTWISIVGPGCRRASS